MKAKKQSLSVVAIPIGQTFKLKEWPKRAIRNFKFQLIEKKLLTVPVWLNIYNFGKAFKNWTQTPTEHSLPITDL